MMARKPFRVEFFGRPVEAAGGQWSALEDAFSDPGVAMDFVRHLEPRCGPTVIAASATGGSAAERKPLDGYWLADDAPGALGNNVLLDAPNWEYNDRARMWASGRPTLNAWESCSDARWLLHFAASCGADPRAVVAAACACVKSVRWRMDAAAVATLDDVEAWARGDNRAITLASFFYHPHEMQVPSDAMSGGRQGEAAAAARGVAQAAYYARLALDCPDTTSGRRSADRIARRHLSVAVSDAAFRAYLASAAVEPEADAERVRALRGALLSSGLADSVRSNIPALLVLRALAARARRRP